MRAVIFTCGRDREKAARATQTIPASWDVAWVVDEPDKEMTPPAGVELIVAPFPRGRTLNGWKACLGVAKVLAEQADRWGRVAKIDSDCLLIKPEFLMVGELAGIAHASGRGAAYGLAYALSPSASQRALDGILDTINRGCYPQAEDVAITTHAKAGGGVLARSAMWQANHRGGLPHAGAVAIHCGGTAYAGREGGAVAAEMTRLGDGLGLWRRG